MQKNLIIIYNLKYLQRIFPLKKIQVYNSEITIVMQENFLKDLLFFLKNNVLCQFDLMTSISCVDYPVNRFRFQLIYDLLSLRYNSRIRIKIFTHELLQVSSCVQIFSVANWFECEIWDMFGVFFTGHPNLKRLLTDYGFEGYPLRKDFPLSGFIEMRFIENSKKVSSESIEFTQEYRTFNFISPWQA